MVALVVEPHAGIPGLRQPRSGHSHDGTVCGQVGSDHLAQLHTPSGATYLVADRALSSAAHLQKLADTRLQWSPRGPATLREAQAVWAQAAPQTLAPLPEGSRYRVVPSR